MTPTPLAKIRLFSWQDHKSALWWLGLLYRRPVSLREIAKKLSWKEAILINIRFWLHFLPYLILISIVGRIFRFGILNTEISNELTSTAEILLYHAKQIAFGIVFGILGGIGGGIFGIIREISGGVTRRLIRRFAYGIASGIAFGIAVGITFGSTAGITIGISAVIVLGILFGITGVIDKGSSGKITNTMDSRTTASGVITLGMIAGFVGGVAFGIGGGIALIFIFGVILGFVILAAFMLTGGIKLAIIVTIAFGIIVGIGFGLTFGISLGIFVTIFIITLLLRLYYYPFHILFIWPKVQEQWYSFHPVAWDGWCVLPFPGLYRLLLAYTEKFGMVGKQEIEHLIADYPSQRREALKVKTILIARESAEVTDLIHLNKVLTKLPEGDKGFLGQTRRVRENVEEICRQQIRLNTISRAVLREPIAQLLYTEIENFCHRIGGFHEPLVSEFRKAAENWLKIAQRQLEQARAVTTKEPTPQVFRAGDPVNREQEAFVPRYAVMGELEKQIMLATGCPGLVVYARRRMGKSTLLRNLNGFIPGSVLPVFNSMQEPQLFISLKNWAGAIAQNLGKQVPGFRPSAQTPQDLPGLFNYLSECNTWLEKEEKRILLEIDEYENIDLKIGEKVFPQDLLATIRESIQSHRRITWIFAGSHEISELKNAPWTSYLVSARTLEVPMFTPGETRLLLTEPLKYSTLWEKDDPRRPRFAAEFWGDGGIERIHNEAGGWPHLVQLIAETIVDLMNDEDTREVNAELMERALDKAIISGHNVLYELVRRECALPGEWEYLSAFRKSEFQPPPGDKAIYRSLRRRLLVAEENGRWRLRVPLMLRWLRQRG